MRRLLSIALASVVSLAHGASRKPDYPLSGIVSSLPENAARMTGETVPLADAVAATRLIYTSDTPALRAALRARNDSGQKTPPVIVYMGGFTTNGDDVIVLERDFRTGIAMTPVAKLGVAIDAVTTRFPLTEPVDGELAVKASTADASDTKDSRKFCFWLRVDDELMQVTAVDTASATITVRRGFGGTAAAAHSAGEVALSPVYLGNRRELGAARHTNSWPGGPDYLRYAVDPRQPAAAKFKGGVVVRFMQEGGYDGGWFDTFNPSPYNLCDALGRKVSHFWDFAQGRPYTFATHLDAMKTYLRNVRATVLAATGRQPVLYANSASASYARGLKELFNTTEIHDLLDGYCFEDSYLKVVAARAQGRDKAATARFEPILQDRWLVNLTNHADAAKSGLSGLCMAGPAGYLASYLNPTQPGFEQLLRFSYASYLLTVTSGRSTSFGYTLFETAANRAVAWPGLLFLGIGEPAQPNDIPALKMPGSPCYSRKFTRGMAVVNPSLAEARVTIPAGYVDGIARRPVTDLTLASGDGAILLKE